MPPGLLQRSDLLDEGSTRMGLRSVIGSLKFFRDCSQHRTDPARRGLFILIGEVDDERDDIRFSGRVVGDRDDGLVEFA